MAKILLVDDDAMISEINSDVLRSEGHEVIVSVDGNDALNKLKAGGFDLILMDVVLPQMSGFDIVAQVKKDVQITSPVIFLTNSDYQEDKEKAKALGAPLVVKATLTPPELIALVKQYVVPKSNPE